MMQAPVYDKSSEPSKRESPSEAGLTIRLFGSMEVTVDNLLVQLPSRRSFWLLAILSLRNGQPIERSRLAGMLWPDSSDSASLHNLRQTLAGIRRSLGSMADCIVAVSPRSLLLQDSPEVWIDALEFDAACKAGDLSSLQHAVELYRGSILPECDEPFASQEREKREHLFLDITDRLAEKYEATQDQVRGTQILRRAIDIDPYRESAYRALIGSLAASGETNAALELYRTLRETLRRDLNSEPDPETKQLYRSIRKKLSEPTSAAQSNSPRMRNLPVPLTSLIGRQQEIQEVVSLIGRCRLVTLTGVGGVGKTKLALAVAEALGDSFLNGARFIDLSPLQDSNTVPSAIAYALGIHEQSDCPLLETIADALNNLEHLIVIDNCEHVQEGVAATIEYLLSSSPTLHVLATSRQSIGVAGELVWRVPSLQTPGLQEGELKPSEMNDRDRALRESDSVQLFLERSILAGNVQSPCLSQLETIGSICRRLDGIPLAIELAAARTRVLSVSEIEERLDDRFSLLAGGSRSIPRHQTLQAAIEWSWDLLSTDERNLLMFLSMFRGGCALEAIEATAAKFTSNSSIELLSNLVDRSLVMSTPSSYGQRSLLLETIRHFAAERLQESGLFEEAFTAYCEFWLHWTGSGKPGNDAPEEAAWFQRLEIEHDNLRAALAWCMSQGSWDLALQMVVLLSRFWDTCGHISEGRRHLEAILSQDTSHLRQRSVAEANSQLGWVSKLQEDYLAAEKCYEKALTYFRGAKDDFDTACTLNCLASTTYYLGDFDRAKTLYEESLDQFRQLGRPGGAATVLSNLAGMALARGDNDAARTYLEQSIHEGNGSGQGGSERKGQTLCSLALVDLRQNCVESAKQNVLLAISLFEQSASVVSVPNALDLLAIIEANSQSWERASQFLGCSQGLANSLGCPLTKLLAGEREESIALVQTAIGMTAYDRDFSRGVGMTLDEAITLAKAGAR